MSTRTDAPITPAIASHVLYAFGEGGYEAGSFFATLIEAIVRADPSNRHRLALGFPAYVRAVELIQHSTDGTVLLQQVTRGHDAAVNR